MEKEYNNECEKYDIWREFLGKKFEKRRKWFNTLLMPDSIIEIIKKFSLGSVIETLKPNSQRDSKEITKDDLISLYALEKKVSHDKNNNGSNRTKKMWSSMQKYFNEDLKILGLEPSDDEFKVVSPKNIKDMNKIKELKRNIPKFANEFKNYINSLEEDYLVLKNDMQTEIEEYDEKTENLQDILKKYPESHRRKRVENKIKKYDEMKENLWREIAIYEMVIDNAKYSIDKHKKDMSDNLKGLIEDLEGKNKNIPGYV